MANVHDVAAAILEQTGMTTAMKLQKLVFYAQAWHSVWDEEPLVDVEFEAWQNGPVCRELYDGHRGLFQVDKWERGEISALTKSQRGTINVVVNSYGKLTAQQLSDLTHSEDPWRDARRGLDAMERSSIVISLASMNEYYGSLGDESVDVEPF